MIDPLELEMWTIKHKQKYKTITVSRLTTACRARVRDKSNVRNITTKQLLGCSAYEALFRIELRFKPGMSFDNWGRTGWHLDHRKPASFFNLNYLLDIYLFCHVNNLQPLWHYENRAKWQYDRTEYNGELSANYLKSL
jgi:hypothetical protein